MKEEATSHIGRQNESAENICNVWVVEGHRLDFAESNWENCSTYVICSAWNCLLEWNMHGARIPYSVQCSLLRVNEAAKSWVVENKKNREHFTKLLFFALLKFKFLICVSHFNSFCFHEKHIIRCYRVLLLCWLTATKTIWIETLLWSRLFLSLIIYRIFEKKDVIFTRVEKF